MEMEADGLVLTDTTVDKYKGFQVSVIKGDRISRIKVKRLFGKHGVDDNQCHRAGLQLGRRGVVTIQSRRLCRRTAPISRSVSSPELACSGCQVDASCRFAFHPSRTSPPDRKKETNKTFLFSVLKKVTTNKSSLNSVLLYSADAMSGNLHPYISG